MNFISISLHSYKVRRVLVAILAVLSTFSAYGAQCARNENELNNNPQVRELLDRSGGVSEFQGLWNFPGVFGMGSKRLVFQSRLDGFKARVGNSDFQSVRICSSDKDKNLLEVQIMEPASNNVKGVVLVKPTEQPGVIQVAAQESKWKFYEFSKTPTLAMASDRLPASVRGAQ